MVIRAGAERLDELEPSWNALRAHHHAVTPHWGALRDADDSWARRRATYAAILAEGGVLFLAVEDERIAGHAICETEHGGSPTWVWLQDVLALVDLVVLPEFRGRGIGAALMAAVEAEGRKRGVAALDLAVVAPNTGARRFYERHGFRADIVTYRKPLG